MQIHGSTYRIQFNHAFPFNSLEKFVEYLSILGIDALYASPVLRSTSGSMHGYDVTDPILIDPEIGGVEDFENLSGLLKRKNIGWIQDIVPNHMAFNRENSWLWDVLEKGKNSEYASFFDIDWSHPYFKGKLMVPFLGNTFEKEVEDGNLKLDFDEGRFILKYYDIYFPVNFAGFLFLYENKHSDCPLALDQFFGSDGWNSLPPWSYIKKELHQGYDRSEKMRQWVEEVVKKTNARPSTLQKLHEEQHYRLCHWKLTEKKINYRRFFTVNSLICLKMEDQWVFDKYHQYLNEFIREGKFNGLRIDHIDGLRDPERYLRRLRQLAGEDMYIVIEKILELEEDLPSDWRIQGTTGYEFLAYVNNLFTNTGNFPRLHDFYKEITGIKDDIQDIVYEKKKFILKNRMVGELENLNREFFQSHLVPEIQMEETDPGRMQEAIAEFLLAFPVYRLYDNRIPLIEENADAIKNVISTAVTRTLDLEKELNILLNLFTGQYGLNQRGNEKLRDFFMRCMQFTGPLMAKGMEDTTMYYYNCFAVHNEVGDHPAASGFSVDHFHDLMQVRQSKWPLAMNSTSTHDTKRGEDVRARLNVVSDLAPEWETKVRYWMELNREKKKEINGKIVPTNNEEYLIYQTLTGIWPFDDKIEDSFRNRLEAYFTKAMRESKTHTTWNDPDEDHERTLIEFINEILDPEREFYGSFTEFQHKIRQFGLINSLTQVILKMTCPGIPDVYQGTELWDLSLVDPDNRRPVDYERRQNKLKELMDTDDAHAEKLVMDLLSQPGSGEIKLWFTHLLLHERKLNPGLFTVGEYIPLEVTGDMRAHVIAYARRANSSWAVVILPLNLAVMKGKEVLDRKVLDWKNTSVKIPDPMAGDCLDVLRKKKTHLKKDIRLNDHLRNFPYLVLKSV